LVLWIISTRVEQTSFSLLKWNISSEQPAIEKYLGGYPDLIQWLKWEVCTHARDATKV
jgi:hypothetical protein